MASKLDWHDVEPLLSALGDPDPTILLATLNALVALPLSVDAWRPVCERTMDLLVATDAPAPALIDVAIQVPAKLIRERLRRLLGSERPEVREAAAAALGRAGDPVVRDEMVRILKGTGAATAVADSPAAAESRVQAAEILATMDCGPVVDALRVACRRDPCAEVRIFSAIALANVGDATCMAPAMAAIDTGEADFLYHGDPAILQQRIRRVTRIPHETLTAIRRRVRRQGFARSGTGRVAADILNPFGDDEDAATGIALDPDLLLRGVELAGLRGVRQRQQIVRLRPDQARELVNTALEALSRQNLPPPMVGNHLVNLVAAIRRPFVPDLVQLFERGRDLPEDQLAWIMARGGMAPVVAELGPLVAHGDDIEQRLRAARLIRLAGIYRDVVRGPIRGGGVGPPERAPPKDVIEELEPEREMAMSGSDPDSATRGEEGEAPDREREIAIDRSETEDSGPRRLQADVAVEHDGETHKVKRAFVAGLTHRVALSIGRGGDIQADVDFEEPAATSSAGFEWLQVHVQEADGALLSSGRIKLPHDRHRNSQSHRFELAVAADAEAVALRVSVLHQGRVLQRAWLRGDVVDSVAAERRAPGAIGLPVELEVHAPDHLTGRTAFDAAVVADEDSVTAFSGHGLTAGDLGGVHQTMEKITRRLFEASKGVAVADGALDPDSAIDLLRYLAVQGRTLYTTFIRQKLPELESAASIQIVPADASRYLPLEFVYSGREPTRDATLCGGWRQALDDGVCPTCRPDDGSGERSAHICPLGFWSLSKLIERHAPARAKDGQEFRVGWDQGGRRATLRPLRRALWASSDQVPEAEIETTGEFLRTASAQAEEVLSWDDWRAQVKALSPTILISMPHNAFDPNLEVSELELARGPALRLGEVAVGHVRDPERPIADSDRPVVVLLGCRTGQADDHRYLTFVGGFRISGAAVVIGTLSTVLAEHSPPVVKALIEQLANAGKTAPGESEARPSRLGELMRRTRRELFARGFVVALGTVAFGDADWRIEG